MKIDITKINKLVPPEDAMKRFIDNDRKRTPNNPIMRFFKLFFGEGI